MNVAGVVFDKDGTLFDFGATWDVWAGQMIVELSEGCAETASRIAKEARYDLESKSFFPDSPIIAGTNREAAECVARGLPDRDVDEIEHYLMVTSCDAPLQEAVPLSPFLRGLSARGLKLGVCTNDTERAARAHLGAVGVMQDFDFISGFDSGFGMKPGPGPLLAFVEAVGIAPEAAVMVGDSTHDLVAGKRAGMRTVGVLTGPARTEELAGLADVVLPDIGHLPAWLDQL